MRTNQKFTRVYVNGYDVSGNSSDIGTVGNTFDAPLVEAYSDAVKNTVIGQGNVVCGPINAFLSPNSGSSISDIATSGSGQGTYDIMIPFGIQAEPVVGVPVFCAKMENGEFTSGGKDVVSINLAFPDSSYAGVNNYDCSFGYLVHAKGAETGANTAVGTIDAGSATAFGGVMYYQLFSSDGTVTLSIDDSATNANNAAFSALSGATSGSIDASAAPKSGAVALVKTATVRRYLRWQLALGTANTATFAIAFIRGT